jgi:adenylate cyclase
MRFATPILTRPASTISDGMRHSIGLKIFSIAVVLLLIMAGATFMTHRLAGDVTKHLRLVETNYVPAFGAIAEADAHSLEAALHLRRLIVNFLSNSGDGAERARVRDRLNQATSNWVEKLQIAHERIEAQIDDPLNFDDDVALARIDDKVEALIATKPERDRLLARLDDAIAQNDKAKVSEIAAILDDLRDPFQGRLDAARQDLLKVLNAATENVRARQHRVAMIDLGLTAAAGILGLLWAAVITGGLVRSVRRLVNGVRAIEKGALDTMVPVTTRDEIGVLTDAFNHMVGELRQKAQIHDTFGKYLDPRIVKDLIDRPELTAGQGARRVMTVLFCDLAGFTALSERMTPAAMVSVMNCYLSAMSEPIRAHDGIIDKYIGDAIMAFWGPPFTGEDDHARLACWTALEQLSALEPFRATLPDLIGIKRDLPEIQMRVGIATGEVVVGNIGSDFSMSYTVMGDAVNMASRLEGANKSYGTHSLVSALTAEMVTDVFQMREIDTVLPVGRHEPERIFELLGRKGAVENDVLALRDRYADGLSAYRGQDWGRARAAFEACLALVPDDGPSQVFLDRIGHLASSPPAHDWNGVWALTQK